MTPVETMLIRQYNKVVPDFLQIVGIHQYNEGQSLMLSNCKLCQQPKINEDMLSTKEDKPICWACVIKEVGN